ncbi:MAG TPA: FtsX-like permease family protein, partial [Bryobacteraceae bacterium]|nr:FtsX-like permease family protein [Bryobacteraceae bacterium]
VLLIGAALFVRSFRNLATVNPGFELQGLSFAFVNFGDLKLPQERIRPMQRELLERVRSIPGIKAASSATHVPFSGSSWTLSTKLDDGSTASAQFMWVSPDYFKTVGVPIRAGRDISDHDTQDSRKVVLINETYARMFFPNTNPIGRTVHSLAEPGYPDAVYEVIGVVGDTYYGNIRGDQRPIAYAPETQNPNVGPGLPVVLKSSTSDQEALRAVREAITRTYPGAKVFPLSMQTLVHDVLIRERLLAWVCGFFGLLAIALAVIGVYGVVSHLTERRRSEVGIRLALGANRRDVMWLFLRRVGLLLAVGSVAGTAVSLLLSRGIASLLFGIAPQDTLTLVGSAAVLAGVGLAATLIPVMRAAAADPVSCLRCE